MMSITSRLISILAVAVLSVQSLAVEDAETSLQIKQMKLKKKKVRLDVNFDAKEYVMNPEPLMDYVPNKGSLIEGCVINQGELVEVQAHTKSFQGQFPVSMHNRWYKFLGYKDAEFLIYREDKFKPFKSVSFSRAGMNSEILGIDLKLISGKEDNQIIFMRDVAEENGPTENTTAAMYTYIYPTTIVYQEVNFLGKTVKSKVYNTDNELTMIDAVTSNKKMYVVTANSLEAYTVNENTMKKEYEYIIPVNSVSQMGFTKGGLYLITIKNSAGNMELVANDKLSLEGYYTHLKGKHITLFASGNKNYVAFIKDDFYQDKGTYYFIINPSVSKPSSLVFEKIPELDEMYSKVFELNTRIHFIKGTDHAMFTKGAKKSLVKLRNSLPLLGVLYWSWYQYLEEDKFLVVSDIGSNGNLKVMAVNLTNPKVICPPRLGSIERYEKFSVFTKTAQYDFDVLFKTTGVQNFVSGTYFDQAVCIILGIAVTGFAFIWLKRSINNRDFKRINEILKQRRETLVARETQTKKGLDILDKINQKLEQDAFKNEFEGGSIIDDENYNEADSDL